MIKRLNETVSLKDSRGNAYVFDLYSYDTMDDVQDLVKDQGRAGLYIFAKRYIQDGKICSNISYIGETSDYSTRGYSNHHKRKCIEAYSSNEFGMCPLTVSDDKRLQIESDLIDRYDPPCNG